jgi:hypothetical protein
MDISRFCVEGTGTRSAQHWIKGFYIITKRELLIAEAVMQRLDTLGSTVFIYEKYALGKWRT